MSSNVRITLHPSFEVLAATTAARLITRLLDVQSERGEATVVLTGGSVGIATLREVAKSPAHLAVDWGKVNFWFGDDRFVPAGSADRNCLQAAEALLDHVPVDPSRVHTMAASDTVDGLEEAVAQYAAELAAAAQTEWENDDASPAQAPAFPRFDVLLLGLGPDAHIASLFPEMAGIRTKGVPVVGVRNSPKPPPLRVSLTLEVGDNLECSVQDIVVLLSHQRAIGRRGPHCCWQQNLGGQCVPDRQPRPGRQGLQDRLAYLSSRATRLHR